MRASPRMDGTREKPPDPRGATPGSELKASVIFAARRSSIALVSTSGAAAGILVVGSGYRRAVTVTSSFCRMQGVRLRVMGFGPPPAGIMNSPSR